MIPMVLPFSFQGTPAPLNEENRRAHVTGFGAPASTAIAGSRTLLALDMIQWY